jgi:hypothetical protein
MAKEATPQELDLLWSAVADGDYVEDASDGHLRWAFLFHFQRQGAAAIFPGLMGAIVYVEEQVGPIAAWLYNGSEDLTAAWQNAFPVERQAAPGVNG